MGPGERVMIEQSINSEYLSGIRQCTNLQELFQLWQRKQKETIEFMHAGKIITETVNHQSDNKEKPFIPDGIVNPNIWNSGKKRILYVMKEAYGDGWGGATLATWIQSGDCIRYHIWRRIAEWTYGIENTTEISVPRYRKLTDEEMKESLQQIAVLNLKKSGGTSESWYEEIAAYSAFDREEIRKEFDLIDADIIVCGSTFGVLLEKVFEHPALTEKKTSDNWYYFEDFDGSGKRRLYIDGYHPANRWPDLMNYYTVASIYQQALKANRIEG